MVLATKRVFVALALLAIAFGQIVRTTPACPREWDYQTASTWGTSCPQWASCGASNQSPIDLITPGVRLPSTPIWLQYKDTPISLFNTGRALKMPVSKNDGNLFVSNGASYYLKEIRWVSPSEHTINGKSYELEMQLVHDSLITTGDRVVIVALFNLGGTNALLDRFFFQLPEFSDCSCGNGRVEPGEECDNGVGNANEPNKCRKTTDKSGIMNVVMCTLPKCGDGIVDKCEECDEGNNNSNTRDAACRLTCNKATCGDGFIDRSLGEECDDGNRFNLDGCDSLCKLECGDGVVNPLAVPGQAGYEECDLGIGVNGNGNQTNRCRGNCRNATCGDGIVDSVSTFGGIWNYVEACDNGTANSNSTPNACRLNCRLPSCGDNIVDNGEQCDDGPNNGPNQLCASNCTFNCGDGVVQTGEQCDLGRGAQSNAPNAACRTTCESRRCGDGIIDTASGETCDNGWLRGARPGVWAGDVNCSATCQIRCGNGKIDPAAGAIPAEECDVSINYNNQSDVICRSDCTKAKCGDRIVDYLLGETCDNGAANSNNPNAACRPNCRTSLCGDGIVDSILLNEQCDDGNHNAEDGCDPNCKYECGNSKLGVIPPHRDARGNLVTAVAIPEQCDAGAGNANEPNKCRKTSDKSGTMNVIMCTLPRCGDGIIDDGEECDEGDDSTKTIYNSFGPNRCRPNCRKPWCGDGVTDSVNGEKCDAGLANSDTNMNGCSTSCIQNSCRQSIINSNEKKLPLGNLYQSYLNGNTSTMCYSGSLSEPPCDGNVKYVVFENTWSLSALQLAQFRAIGLGGQSKPLQAVGSRSVAFCNPNAVPTKLNCGNGIKEGNEECDEGVRNSDTSADACRTNCKLARCGDGIVDRNEECDDPTNPMCTACKLTVLKSNPFQSFWSYKRADEWGRVASWGSCGGSMQSPINLVRDMNLDFGDVNTLFLNGAVQYSAKVPIEVYNTGKSAVLKVTTGATNRFVYNGTNYDLQYIEIHRPSEHHLNGKEFDFEIQFVHKVAATNQYAAISVFYETEETFRNKFLEQFWFFIPKLSEYKCGNGRVEPGEQCDDGEANNDFKPNSCRTNCRLPGCGDGVVDRNEACDWGPWNSNEDGACRTNCRFPRCGDNAIDASMGEECDPPGVGCDNKCKKLCGNGRVDPGEQCDNGPQNSATIPSTSTNRVCRANCLFSSCGDGILDFGEACDAGTANGNRSNACRVPGALGLGGCTLPYCGDGIVDPAFGEECDSIDRTICSATCKLLCGDGVVTAPEECDNGGNNSRLPGACRQNCRKPFCGDGIVDPNEQCDLGTGNYNPTNPATGNSRCDANCTVRCGNGVREIGEDCDEGTKNSDNVPDCCRTNCKAPYCGDGVRDSNEECDFNAPRPAGSVNPCRPDCKLRRCGDSTLDAGEECDDGNNVADDGCSPTCKKECGNGMKNPGEQCDNGPLNSDILADACRVNCQLPKCGDGVVDTDEQCDDRTAVGADVANKCRSNCKLPVCGDGFIDTAYGEQCDSGAANSDTALSGCGTDCKLNAPRQCTTSTATQSIDFSKSWPFPALGSDSGVFVYSGSLTAPPCNESVTWFVFEKAQKISKMYADQFASIFSWPNIRGVQPVNGRRVMYPTTGAKCGNCKREGTEECDDGELNSNTLSGACRTDCRKARCGDGVVDTSLGEQCDGHPGCDAYCKWVTACPLSAPGTCPGSTAQSSCPSGSCSNAQQTPANSTVINVNFAGILSKSSCTSCNK